LTVRVRLQIAFALPKALDQLLFQSAKLPDLLTDRAEFPTEQLADVRTRFAVVTLQDEQFPDLRKRKPQLLNAPNEPNPLDILPAKQPKSAFCARWTVEEALFLIEPDGIDAQPRLLRDLANLHAVPHLIPEYTLE
jgi:hypothetical protein